MESRPTSGTGGFWWCGYFGMRGKDMPIDDVKVNLLQYDHVTICAPIWVFNLCSPMQTFCKQAKGKVKSVSYVILHHTKARYAKVFDKMDAMLGLTRKDAVSICCKMGNYKRLKQK